jgi:hypothetical protein
MLFPQNAKYDCVTRSHETCVAMYAYQCTSFILKTLYQVWTEVTLDILH